MGTPTRISNRPVVLRVPMAVMMLASTMMTGQRRRPRGATAAACAHRMAAYTAICARLFLW